MLYCVFGTAFSLNMLPYGDALMLSPPAEWQVVQLTLPYFALLTHLRMPLIADAP